jgi:hypothetical protein
MSLTKKIEGKRVMKVIEGWYGVNRTTPERWFIRWENFLVSLMEEVGYQVAVLEPIERNRGKLWCKLLEFRHPTLHAYKVDLKRKRNQAGGNMEISYYGTTSLAHRVEVDTLSLTKNGYAVMSRTKVGDQILNHIREGWSKDKDVNQED